MNLKSSLFTIKDKKLRDFDFAKEYPTLKDLMKEQGVSNNQIDYRDKEFDDNLSGTILLNLWRLASYK